MLNCSCYRKGFCIVRDDDCKPNSFKCIKNKESHKYSVLATVPNSGGNSYRKVDRYNRDYNPFINERYGHNVKVEELELPKTKRVLYVFKGFLNVAKINTIDYYLKFTNLLNGQEVRVLVAYNQITQKYYISATQLRWLHDKGIFPKVKFKTCNDGSIPLITGDFSELSELSLYGYSAGKKGMKTKDRHKLLNYIIDNNIMSRYEIIKHLQGLINLREGRTDRDFSEAISNWESDIIYVNNRR